MMKRVFDICFALVGLVLTAPLLLMLWLVLSLAGRTNGLFTQDRVGRYGRTFTIYKLRTLYPGERRFASALGKALRQRKLDELPQLLNVLKGDMSVVGPRPDVPGYYDRLQGEARQVLDLRPGITSEASLKYRDEDALLARQADPLRYNDEVLFPDKVRMNLDYFYTRSFWGDLMIIIRTILKQ